MIIGIGADLCDIRRIEKIIEKFGVRFTHRIFTQIEREYCEAKSGKAAYYAKRFAAKEAIAKTIAGPRTGPLSWQDVEVVNDASGRPRARLYRGARRRINRLCPEGHDWHVHLSLTDDAPYAQAFAIAEALPFPAK